MPFELGRMDPGQVPFPVRRASIPIRRPSRRKFTGGSQLRAHTLIHAARLPRRAAFWLVTAGFALVHVGTNLLSPLYGVFAARFGFSTGILATIFAVYAFTVVPLMVLCGRASDRWGRRRLVIAGLAIAASASVVLAYAQGTGWLFVGRILQGVAMGAISGAASAGLTELEPQGDRSRAAVISTTAFSGGAAAGPVAAGLLAQYAPHPTRLAFVLHAAIITAVAVALMAWVEPPPQVSRTRSARPRLAVPAGFARLFARASGAAFSAWAVVGLFLAVVPSYASELLSTTNLAVLGCFPGALLASSCLTQLVGRSMGYDAGVTWGLGLLVAGMGSVVAAFPTRSLWLLIAGSLVAGAGHGLAFSSAVRGVNELVPPDHRGGLLSTLYVALYLGVGGPVVGVGFLSSELSLFGAVSVFAATIGVIAVGVALLRDNKSC